MSWLCLILAGIAEVLGITLLKLSEGFIRIKYSIACIVTGVINFYLLSLALCSIPIGTAYGIWTGIGSAGSIVIGMVLFHESRNRLKLMFLSFIIIGVIGLKMTSVY